MPSKNTHLILIITSIIFLAVPFSAHAGIPILEDIMNAASIALEGVEEVTGPLVAAFLKLFLYLVASFVSLIVSAALFGIMIDNPNWFNLNSPVIDSSWHFTAGLANMFLILILIFIAIQFILKIDTFKTKKTLINLIVVAFLINFSLLFVKILVDVPLFAFNSFKIAAGMGGISGFLGELLAPLTGVMLPSIIGWGIAIGALAISFVSPFAAVAQLGFVLAFPATIPFLAIACLFIMAGFLLAGVFITFFFLFVVRAVILAIFAILSPLAFLALILPQTKKYWDMWLKTVVEWSFLGVILLFFLVIGFRGLNFLIPTENPINFGAPGTWGGIFLAIKGWFVYYFCLFIYLLLVAGVSKKLMPTFAQGLISGTQQLGGMIWATGIKPMSAAAKSQIALSMARQEKLEREKAERGEALTRSERISKKLHRPVGLAFKAFGTTAEIEAGRDIKEKLAKEQKAIEHLDEKETLNLIHQRGLRRTRRAAAFQQAMKKGWLTDREAPFMRQAEMYGVSREETLNKYPHWAAQGVTPEPGQTQAQAEEKAIIEQVERMTPEDMRKEMTAPAAQDIRVLYGMDLSQAQEIRKKGKIQVKNNLYSLVVNNQQIIQNKVNQLRAANKNDAADRLKNTANYIKKYYS